MGQFFQLRTKMSLVKKSILALLFTSSVLFAGQGHGHSESKSNMMHDDSKKEMMHDKDMDMDMKSPKMMDDEDDGMMMKKSGNKPSRMACGAGKCGAGKCGGAK